MATITRPSQPPILLLELLVGSETLRYAARPVQVGVLRFTGGLDLDLIEELELTADGVPTRQLSVQVTGDVSLVARLPHLTGARVLVYLWAGGTLDDAELKFRGTVAEPTTGEPGVVAGLAGFSARELDGEDRPLLVSTDVVDETTFPAPGPGAMTGELIPDAYAGAYYPEVIGNPGTPYTTWWLGEGVAPGSPAVFASHGSFPFYADESILIVKRGTARVTSARVWDQDGHTNDGDLVQLQDLRGRTFTAVDLSTVASALTEPSDASDVSTGWAVGWYAPPTTGPWGALRGLGDVLLWALERAGVDRPGADRGRAWDVDWASVAAIRHSLNRFKIDTFIAEQVGVWEWLTRDLLPFFPIAIGRSGRGLRFAEWRFRARAADAVLTLEEGRNAHRLSPYAQVDSSDVYSEVVVNLGLGARSGDAMRSITLSGGAVANLLPEGAGRDALLELAFARVGRRALSVDVPVVWDTATGYEVAEFLCARYAAPLGELWYRLPWQLTGAARASDVVRVVSAPLGLDLVGTVTGERAGPGCVDLRILPHPS